jgi:hypothetical protein
MEMPKSASAGLFAELGWRLSGAIISKPDDLETLLKLLGPLNGLKMTKGEKHE